MCIRDRDYIESVQKDTNKSDALVDGDQQQIGRQDIVSTGQTNPYLKLDVYKRQVESCFNQYLENTISIRDTFVRKPLKENFYHGILLGILAFKNGWYVQSNKAAGTGYGDILIQMEELNIGIVIEVKYAENENLTEVCQEMCIRDRYSSSK